MAEKARTLKVVVTGDSEELRKAIRAANEELDGLGDKSGKTAAKLDNFGKKAMGVAAVGTLALYGLGSAADDQNASFSALNQVLGDSADEVTEWSKDSVRAVGLSKRAAADAATSFGSIAKAAGMAGDEVSDFAIEQTTLAADLAAFKNVDPAEAIRDLQAGYAGSTEVLRKYNIYVDDATLKAAYFRETGEKVTGTLTSQQKIIATHSEVLRQSKDMQGQWNREIDSAAAGQAMLKASFEDLSANIGQGVLPAMTGLLNGANKAFGAFNSLDEGTQSAIGTFGVYATAAVGTAGALSFVAGKAITAKDRFDKLAYSVDGDGVKSMSKFGKSLVAVGGVVAAVGLAFSLKEIRDEMIGLKVDIDATAKATGDELAESFEKLSFFGEKMQREFIDKLADAGAIGTLERLGEVADLTAEQQEYLAEAIGKATAGAVQQEKDSKATADAVKQYGTETETAGVKLEDFATDVDVATKALKAQIDSAFGAEEATSAYWASIDKLAESLKDNGPTLDLTTEKGRENAEAFRLVTERTAALVSEQAKAGASSTELQAIIDAEKAKLGELADQFGLPRDAVAKYVVALDSIPAVKSTTINVGVRKTVDDFLGGIWGGPSKHSGGIFRAPNPGGVGLALLRDGERVLTPSHAGGGGGVTVIGNVYGYDDFVRKVQDANASYGRSNS